MKVKSLMQMLDGIIEIKHHKYEHYIPNRRKFKEIHNAHNLHAIYDYHDQNHVYPCAYSHG